MEIKILDMIQNLHTTVGDHFFIGITKLGDAGNYMDFFNNPITYTAQNEKIWTGHVSRALH